MVVVEGLSIVSPANCLSKSRGCASQNGVGWPLGHSMERGYEASTVKCENFQTFSLLSGDTVLGVFQIQNLAGCLIMHVRENGRTKPSMRRNQRLPRKMSTRE